MKCGLNGFVGRRLLYAALNGSFQGSITILADPFEDLRPTVIDANSCYSAAVGKNKRLSKKGKGSKKKM